MLRAVAQMVDHKPSIWIAAREQKAMITVANR